MIYLTLVLALGLGYGIGLMQGGIKVYTESSKPAPKDFNKSIGKEEYMKYYDRTGGANKF